MQRIPVSARYCLALVLLAVPRLRAQAKADPQPPAAENKENETIVLSPFVVSGDDDKGYRSTSTLAGTRIRTDLKDVGSAISVINAQFLQDTGAKDNQSLLKYTTNTEVGGVGGNFTGVGNGRQVNENANLLRPSSNTRVRGLTAADNTRDFFLTEIPWDGFNIDRVDIQRGPNSILFGFGSPAGIINTSTNLASFKDSGRVEARYDSYGGVRGTIDLNQVVLKDELAIRLDALDEDARFRQEPAFQRQERLYGALRYDPAFLKKNGMVTSFRANIEHGNIEANRPRSMPPGDLITPWFTQMGKRTYNPYRVWNQEDAMRATRIPSDGGGINPNFNPWLGDWAGNYGNTLAVFGDPSKSTQTTIRNYEGNSYWGIGPGGTMDDRLAALATANNYYGLGNPGAWDNGIGGLAFARQIGVNGYATYADYVLTPTAEDPFHQGLPYKSLGAYKDKQINNPGVFDYYNNLLDGPNKHESQGWRSFNLNLSQTFLNNRLGIEGAYDNQEYHEFQKNGVQPNLFVEINTYNLDVAANPNGLPTPGGAANPYLGEGFVKTDVGASRYNSKAVAKRVTGFGEVRGEDFLSHGTLSRIIGRHVFTGMYAEEEKSSTHLDFVQDAFDPSYAYFNHGTETYSLYSRAIPSIQYLTGNLSGLADPNQIHLQRVNNTLRPNLQDGKFFAFDSHWKWPALPSQAGYVDPSAFWSNPVSTDAAANTQAENPANYNGWSWVPGKTLGYDKGDEGSLYTQGLKTWRQVKSQAFVWQAYMFDETIVPMIGWRRDEYRGGSNQARQIAQDQIDATDPKWTVARDGALIAGEAISWSVVAHTPKFIASKLPFHTRVDLFFNRSENFKPTPGDVDVLGRVLDNPTGHTKDYGFVIATLEDRLSLKVNWYETKVANDRLQGFEFWRLGQTAATLLGSAYRVNNKDPNNSWKWDYSSWTANGGQARADAGAKLVLDTYKTNPVFKSFVDSWGMTGNLSAETSNYIIPPGTTGSSDTISKGVEFELSAEPVKGWSASVNVSKTSATQVNIGGALKQFIETMNPVFNGAAGDLRQWWAGDGNNFRTLWSAQVLSQYNRLKAQEGSDVPELRPWRFNAVSTYTFQNGALKNVFAGGGYRWEDSVVVGYPVITVTDAATNQPTMIFDVKNPYHGPKEDHLDLWLGYSRHVTKKINWRIQLNVRDLLAKKKLIPVSVEPDGSGATYRIPDLTSWTLTNSFEF